MQVAGERGVNELNAGGGRGTVQQPCNKPLLQAPFSLLVTKGMAEHLRHGVVTRPSLAGYRQPAKSFSAKNISLGLALSFILTRAVTSKSHEADARVMISQQLSPYLTARALQALVAAYRRVTSWPPASRSSC